MRTSADDEKHQSTILFVESEVLARNLIRTFLEQNYDIWVASDGNEALEFSRRYGGSIHVLLTDAEMSAGDGVPLHRQVGAERPGIRSLLFGDSPKSIVNGDPAPFLNKPFELGALHSELKTILQRDAAKGENARVILIKDSDTQRRERVRQILTGGGYIVYTEDGAVDRDAAQDAVAAVDLVIDRRFLQGLPEPLVPVALLSRVRTLLETAN